MKEIEFVDGRNSEWWGYGDYFCFAPNSRTKILLPYKGEPPFGDSYHKLIVDSKTIRGYIWCGYLLWSKCGNFFTCDWLEGMKGQYIENVWHPTQILRATIVVSPVELQYRVVVEPSYLELGVLRREGRDKELWDFLLNSKEPAWEQFR